MDRKTIGRLGEEKAAEYLRDRGYKILARNWKCKLGEIDIVAFRGGTFIFVEVKALSKPYSISNKPYAELRPEDHLTPRKHRKLQRLGEYYLVVNHHTAAPWQIDLIAVEILDGHEPDIRHVKRIL